MAERGRKLVTVLAVLAAALAAVRYYLQQRNIEDTDNAQIDCNMSSVSSRVAGAVGAVYVADNQRVRRGDVLATIETADFEVAIAQAKANVAQAEAALAAEDPTVSMTQSANAASLETSAAQLLSAQAGVDAAVRRVKQLSAQVAQARASAQLAELELERGEQLFRSGAGSKASVDQRRTAAAAARANLEAQTESLAGARSDLAQERTRVASARAHESEIRGNSPLELASRRASVEARRANLDLARAQLEQAELRLQYTKITAPASGIASKRSVNVGDHVAPGQQMFVISQIDDYWVTANFRETQVRHMQPGQRATVYVDALDITLRGTVESFAGATGSRLSLLPPENASGNFVKVVQRIPVRIRLAPNQPGMARLLPGMSTVPEVTVR